MGQKVNPTGIRLGITEDYQSNWYAERDYADKLHADIKVRQYLQKALADAQVSRVQIDRPAKNAKVTIHTARPGVLIGQKGRGVETLRAEVSKIMGVPVHLNIEEVKKPELNAKLVAEQVAKQLEQRVMFRRAMKRAVTTALRAGALGIKICVSGRLGGAEIARSEWYREGRVPLHTFRADIDYNVAEAHTTFGVIGVKVWIFKGEKLGRGQQATQQPEATKEKKKKS
jgi:small subunit ribosomal protein S3